MKLVPILMSQFSNILKKQLLPSVFTKYLPSILINWMNCGIFETNIHAVDPACDFLFLFLSKLNNHI